jgi:hypothetical protein
MRATLQLELRDRRGAVIARRRAHNAVMQTGADLIARLFAGQGTPITHMAVGTSDTEPEAVTRTALRNEEVGGVPKLKGDLAVAIPSAAFQGHIADDPARRIVRVRFHATLPESAAVGTVREAGLLSRPSSGADVLYNRVIFAPFQKGNDHELTLFWEVSFPYGDLQWLQ